MSMMDMLKNAKKMKEVMKHQKNLQAQQFEAQSGGMVTITMNGQMEVLRVQVDPSALRFQDTRKLADAIKDAVNQAMKQVQQAAQASFSSIMSGMNLEE